MHTLFLFNKGVHTRFHILIGSVHNIYKAGVNDFFLKGWVHDFKEGVHDIKKCVPDIL